VLQAKKVRVSETPGKTKHFQTLVLTEDVTLCDCPGLVMPSVVARWGFFMTGNKVKMLRNTAKKYEIRVMKIVRKKINR
jgi:ribosome biogenesis GTPase A